jgi:hypothetical protein
MSKGTKVQQASKLVAMDSAQSEKESFNPTQYVYTNSLLLVEKAAMDGSLDEISGYLEHSDSSVLGFDLSECKFVVGGADINEVEDKLIELYGEQYSLRYTILELAGVLAQRK